MEASVASMGGPFLTVALFRPPGEGRGGVFLGVNSVLGFSLEPHAEEEEISLYPQGAFGWSHNQADVRWIGERKRPTGSQRRPGNPAHQRLGAERGRRHGRASERAERVPGGFRGRCRERAVGRQPAVWPPCIQTGEQSLLVLTYEGQFPHLNLSR